MSEPLRVFLADLHLEDPGSRAFTCLAALLAEESRRADEIYLLGDLCEVWIGDDDDGELAAALTTLLGRTARRSRLFLMHGNRDFLFSEAFARRVGAQLLPDPTLLPDRTLLSHGDALCTDDEAYQALREQLRSEQWQQTVLARSLDERRALAAELRAQSKAANANKAANIMDVNADAVAAAARQHQTRLMVHGHTHRPGLHQEPWGTRAVLGAWERCGWLLRQQGPALSLECFPLVGRYESAVPDPAPSPAARPVL